MTRSEVESVARKVVEQLVGEYGESTVNEALAAEVEDSKMNEASMINDDGPSAQAVYLLDEGMYSEKRLSEIVADYAKEDDQG